MVSFVDGLYCVSYLYLFCNLRVSTCMTFSKIKSARKLINSYKIWPVCTQSRGHRKHFVTYFSAPYGSTFSGCVGWFYFSTAMTSGLKFTTYFSALVFFVSGVVVFHCTVCKTAAVNSFLTLSSFKNLLCQTNLF